MSESANNSRPFPKVLLGMSIAFLVLLIVYLWTLPPQGGLGDDVSAMIRFQVQSAGVFLMRTLVTVSVLGCALWVIVSKRYPVRDRKWAYGAVAAILAFWLAAGAL